MPEHPPDPLIGRLVAGRYRVIKPLGEGGMGQVYLAEHEAIEKKVALKVLRPEYSRKEDIVTRFQQEAISASRIKHPNVLDVFDFGKLDSGEAFLAMEFLEGHDLSDDLAKVSAMDPSRGLHIALQICRALAAAHARGVVHRDMKPDNVFLQRTGDGDEVVKIVDFGIAQLRTTEEAAKSQPTRRRLTKTGMIFGTPEYMAPEQAGGRHADLRVDVYAVGVILYEMFTGAVPFTGDSFMAVLTATMNQPPPPMRQMNPELKISPELEAVIMRALAKHPDQRFATMGELATALVATPEGAPFARPAMGSLADGRLSSYPPAGAPTAAYGSPVAPGTAVSPGGTVAVGAVTSGAPGRTSAQSGAETSGAPAGSPSKGLVLGSLGFVALALVAGGYVAYSRSAGKAAPAPSRDDVATQALAPEPVQAAPAASMAPEPTAAPPTPVAVTTVTPVNAPSKDVHLHVVTEPAGATLSRGGFEVCAATPCDLVANRNEGLELEARKGPLRGLSKIMPQQDQTVTIPLVAPAAKPKAPSGPRMCEVEVDGLKILRPCAK
jgi:eukaryotic-like serine/threonine-protein kinase